MVEEEENNPGTAIVDVACWYSGKITREISERIKVGRFSRTEDEFLMKHLNDYLSERGESMEAFQSALAFSQEKRKKSGYGKVFLEVTKRLNESMEEWQKNRMKNGALRGLEGKKVLRNPVAVYHHLRRVILRDISKTADFTEEEDRLLLKLVALHGHDWVLIAGQVGKSNFCCQDRYKKLARHAPNSGICQGSWSIKELDAMKSAIAQFKELSNQSVNIDWSFVADSVGSRDPVQCRKKWKSLNCNNRISSSSSSSTSNSANDKEWGNSHYEKLCSFLQRDGIYDESEICWGDYVAEMGSIWPAYILQSKWRILRNRIPNGSLLNFDILLPRILSLLDVDKKKQDGEKEFVDDEKFNVEKDVKEKDDIEKDDIEQDVEEVEKDDIEKDVEEVEKDDIEKDVDIDMENETEKVAINEVKVKRNENLQQPLNPEISSLTKRERRRLKEAKKKAKEEKKRLKELKRMKRQMKESKNHQ